MSKEPGPATASEGASTTVAAPPSPAASSPAPKRDPFKDLIPGRIVYYWEYAQGFPANMAGCPAIVVHVFRDSGGQKNGEVRLYVFYHDGADGAKPSVKWGEAGPQADRWTWPMNADGSPVS